MIRRSGDSRRTFSLINSISVYSDSGGIVQLECVSDQVLGLCVFIHLLHWTLFYHDKYIPTSPNCFSIAFDSTTTNMITQFFFLLYLSFMISVSTDKMYTQKVSPSFSHIHLSRCDADEEKKSRTSNTNELIVTWIAFEIQYYIFLNGIATSHLIKTEDQRYVNIVYNSSSNCLNSFKILLNCFAQQIPGYLRIIAASIWNGNYILKGQSNKHPYFQWKIYHNGIHTRTHWISCWNRQSYRKRFLCFFFLHIFLFCSSCSILGRACFQHVTGVMANKNSLWYKSGGICVWEYRTVYELNGSFCSA